MKTQETLEIIDKASNPSTQKVLRDYLAADPNSEFKRGKKSLKRFSARSYIQPGFELITKEDINWEKTTSFGRGMVVGALIFCIAQMLFMWG